MAANGRGFRRWGRADVLGGLAAAAVLLAACRAPVPAQPEPGLILSGTVTDRVDGTGLKGVEISAKLGETDAKVVALTDAAGRYLSDPLPVDQGVTVEVRALGSAASFYPQSVKARMDAETAEWPLDFVQAWPVRMWARAAERIHLGETAGGHPVGVVWAAEPRLGGGVLMDDVPFYYWIAGQSKQYLGATNTKGELFPDPVWLPIGAEVSFGPELEGYRFSPPDCGWRNEPPIESIGILFVGNSTPATPTPGRVTCDQVP